VPARPRMFDQLTALLDGWQLRGQADSTAPARRTCLQVPQRPDYRRPTCAMPRRVTRRRPALGYRTKWHLPQMPQTTPRRSAWTLLAVVITLHRLLTVGKYCDGVERSLQSSERAGEPCAGPSVELEREDGLGHEQPHHRKVRGSHRFQLRPVPRRYVTRLPCQQPGSRNGQLRSQRLIGLRRPEAEAWFRGLAEG
jgi:hypothetical protein